MMLTFINFYLLHIVFVNAKYYQVKFPRTQSSILKEVFSDTGVDLKSLKQLANAFPNYAIEIQSEGIHEESPEISSQQLDWLSENRNLPKKLQRLIARSGGKLDTEMPEMSKSSSPTATTMTTTSEKKETMSTATTKMSDLLPVPQSDHRKRPLYMEDLIQALEDFEKKVDTTRKANHQDITTSSTKIDTTTEDGNRPLVKKDLWDLEKVLGAGECKYKNGTNHSESTPHDNKNLKIKNFNDVLKLINKGVKVQLEVTTPADTDLNWVPIKVPNEN